MNSIRRQLIVFCTLMLIGLAAAGLFMNRIHDKSTAINNNWLPSVAHVSNINMLTSDFRINELQHILSLTDEQMRFYESEMKRIREEIGGELRTYEPLITTSLEKALYADFVSKWNEYLEQHERMVTLSRDNKNEEAKILIRDRSEALFRAYSKSLSTLVAENRHLAQQETDAGKDLMMLSLVNLMFIFGLITFAVYKIARYLKKMFDKVVNTCVSIMAETSV